MFTVNPLGDREFLANFPNEEQAAHWAALLEKLHYPGVVESVAAYRKVWIQADPDKADLILLSTQLQSLEVPLGENSPGKTFLIPTLYDGQDLVEVCETLALSRQELISAHCSRDYHVHAIGFQPGFPYAGDLPPALTGLTRRPSPRTQVPTGSVAIVGRQTAIYPSPSPGGWHLIGRTPLQIVDIEKNNFPLRAGDRLRFIPISEKEYESRRGESL